MKALILATVSLVSLQSAASTASYPWMSLTCEQLIQTVQANEIVNYGNRQYFNKALFSAPERTQICKEIDFRNEALSAPPVRTLDKRNFFDLCPIGKFAFKCVEQIEN